MSDGIQDKSSQPSRRVGDDITVDIGVSLDVWLLKDGMRLMRRGWREARFGRLRDHIVGVRMITT
jgi:hypothetical protein